MRTPKFSNVFYAVEYEHMFYGETKPRSAFAVYFQLESAQEAMMKMIKRGQVVLGLNERKIKSNQQILTILRKDTP